MSVALNTKHLSSFISEEEYAAIYPQVEAAHNQLEAKSGPGNDFLGWMYLPRDYDKKEFARIKEAAAKIREDSDVLVVAGIGGSYLGARAVIEAVKGQFHNELENGPKIYFCGNSISPTYLNNILDLCKGKRFSINVISKSGTTTETSLVTTLTKKMAEDLTDYLLERGIKVEYLHSDVDTLRRVELLRELREGKIDVIVGINLLREGLDLPEVSLVAILDADKEGFLRSYRSLIQTIGRAARNVSGTVIMYADDITDAMHKAIDETNRRRDIQIAYNKEHGIDPKPLIKKISDVNDMLAKEDVDTQTLLGTGYRNEGKAGNSHLGVPATSKEESDRRHEEILKAGLPAQDLADLIRQLSEQMHAAAEQLQFELAARLRDEIRDLKKELRQMTEASK